MWASLIISGFETGLMSIPKRPQAETRGFYSKLLVLKLLFYPHLTDTRSTSGHSLMRIIVILSRCLTASSMPLILTLSAMGSQTLYLSSTDSMKVLKSNRKELLLLKERIQTSCLSPVIVRVRMEWTDFKNLDIL